VARDRFANNPRPIIWHKSAEEILDRLAGYCRSLNKGERSNLTTLADDGVRVDPLAWL
jgi:hypothetical protein